VGVSGGEGEGGPDLRHGRRWADVDRRLLPGHALAGVTERARAAEDTARCRTAVIGRPGGRGHVLLLVGMAFAAAELSSTCD
jgi:hypothetical protein